jgi:serine protease Do
MQIARHLARRFRHARLLLLVVLSLSWVQASLAQPAGKTPLPPLAAVFHKPMPTTVQELKDIQDRVQLVVKQVMPSVVNINMGVGQGSGVIISEDGYVLTAGHVSGTPNKKVILTLADGRKVKAVTLGANRIIDSGLIKITDEGKYPAVEMGNSQIVKAGDWCVAIGHPGGWKQGRDPVVRLGRVLGSTKDVIRTDCTIVGGDSGGPLFDMDGKVIGIHSRIMLFIHANFHVPVQCYQEDWDRLVKGDEIYPGYLGVKRDPDAKNCKIMEVVPDSAAAKAGFKPNDIVTKFAGQKIENFDELVNILNKMRSGDQAVAEVQRGEETVTLTVVLGAFKGKK